MRYDLDSVCSGQDLALCQSSEREERTERERNDGGAVDVRLASRVESRALVSLLDASARRETTTAQTSSQTRGAERAPGPSIDMFSIEHIYIYITGRIYIAIAALPAYMWLPHLAVASRAIDK